METGSKLWEVARGLIDQYGAQAPKVARERAIDRHRNGDPVTATVWDRVGDTTRELLGKTADDGSTG